jgi:hypothetical protein
MRSFGGVSSPPLKFPSFIRSQKRRADSNPRSAATVENRITVSVVVPAETPRLS